MIALACPLVAAVFLAAYPAQVFSAKGLRSLKGLSSYVGYAVFAGAPGSLYLYGWPGADMLTALCVTLACVILCAGLLLPGLVVVSAPARREVPRAPVEAPQPVNLWDPVPRK